MTFSLKGGNGTVNTTNLNDHQRWTKLMGHQGDDREQTI